MDINFIILSGDFADIGRWLRRLDNFDIEDF